jgi:hypothetical protein
LRLLILPLGIKGKWYANHGREDNTRFNLLSIRKDKSGPATAKYNPATPDNNLRGQASSRAKYKADLAIATPRQAWGLNDFIMMEKGE